MDPNKAIELFSRQKRAFKVVRGFSTTEIIYGKGLKNVYVHQKTYSKTLFLFGMVRSDAKEFIKNKKIGYYDYEMYPIYKESEDLDEFQNAVVECTDVNHCYWKTAFNLGIIKEPTYQHGLRDIDGIKETRNASLAVLAGSKTVHKYSKGERVSEELKVDVDLVRVYEMIKFKVAQMMYEMAEILGKDFVMYRTDGIYYNPKRRDEVHRFLMSKNHEFKFFNCRIFKKDGVVFSKKIDINNKKM